MNNRIKGKLSVSNSELSSGLPEPDENTTIEMREIFNEAVDKLRQAFRNEIHRLDIFIKKEYSVIPSEDNFIRWFEDKRMYNNWKELPKILDEDIFNSAQVYLEECKNKVKHLKPNKSQIKFENIILENATYSLAKLVDYFSDEVFKPNTSKQDIENVFNYPIKIPEKTLNLKINNKEFVYLLEEMGNENIVNLRNLFNLIDEFEYFESKGGIILKRNNLDQAKSQLKKTPLGKETEDFLKNLVKNIKI